MKILCNFVSIVITVYVVIILFFHKDDDISPLEEALTTQVVHQLKDKGHSSSTSWGKESTCNK